MSKVVIAGLLLISATSVANAQDLAAGEQSFKKCLPCHAVGEDEPLPSAIHNLI